MLRVERMQIERMQIERMSIKRMPIAKGRSYVLAASALEHALRASGIELEVSLTLGNRYAFLSADFWPPNPSRPYEMLHIVSGDVPVQDAAVARSVMETQALPSFVAWAQALLQLPSNSPIRQRKQAFACDLSGKIWRSNA